MNLQLADKLLKFVSQYKDAAKLINISMLLTDS